MRIRSALGKLEDLSKSSKFARKISKFAVEAGKTMHHGVEALKTALKTQMTDILANAKKAENKRTLGTIAHESGRYEIYLENVEDAAKIRKSPFVAGAKAVGGFMLKHPKLSLLAGGAVGAYVFHEASDTYEEAKLECQETCQGFNKVNLSQLKYDQILNLLYCRDADNNPCPTFIGGGGEGGAIVLNTCPAGCTDIRTSRSEDTHINSMLYGSCNIKDGNKFYCDYPSYKEHNSADAAGLAATGLAAAGLGPAAGSPAGNTKTFGIIPLGDGADQHTLDSLFEDPWHGYAAMSAAAIVEAGIAGAAAGEVTSLTRTGQMLNELPIPGGLAAATGAGAAALTSAFIPDDFPGHCLHKLFEHSTNEDPNNFFRESEDLGSDGGYKYIRKCGAGAAPDAANVVKKCDLATGDVVTAAGHSDTDLYGSCVAWKKPGKCLPTMHSWSLSTLGEEIGEEVGQETPCLQKINEQECSTHEYCYWTGDSDDQTDTGLDNIYFCLNDKSLIDIHNGILDNDDKMVLINQTYSNDTVVDKLDESAAESIKSFNMYSGNKELDIGDICNNYCINYLCHEPYISMTFIPGVNDALGYLKILVNVIIKLIIALFGGIIFLSLTWRGDPDMPSMVEGDEPLLGKGVDTGTKRRWRIPVSVAIIISIFLSLNFLKVGDVLDELLSEYNQMIVDWIVDVL